MPITNVDNEHEQLVSMLNQLMNEREILSRENEYLKAKLNDSVLMETIREMRNERDLLFKLLSNLTMNNNKDEQLRYLKHYIKENDSDILPPSAYQTFNTTLNDKSSTKKSSSLSRHNPSLTTTYGRSYRVKTNTEPSPVIYRAEGKKENLLNTSDKSSPASSHIKHSQANKKIFVYKTSSMPQAQEFNKLIRKHDVQLKHSQNSPFQHYRSQSLQDLT